MTARRHAAAGRCPGRRVRARPRVDRPVEDATPIFRQAQGTRVGRGGHLFGHTFASRLVQAGAAIAMASAWLGHRDIRTMMT